MNEHHRRINSQVVWILGRTHIATPYEDVAADIAERLRANNTGVDIPQRPRAQLITDALIQHRRNRAEYRWVMGSH